MEHPRIGPGRGTATAIVAGMALLCLFAVGDGPDRLPTTVVTEEPSPAAQTPIELGEELYNRWCGACHGVEGRGGVANRNAISNPIPRLDTLGDRLALVTREDGDLAMTLLVNGTDLQTMEAKPPFESFARFRFHLNDFRALISEGRPAGKKNPSLAAPPLHMPAWKERLRADEVNAILAYLIGRWRPTD